jgi:hypothetical protein
MFFLFRTFKEKLGTRRTRRSRTKDLIAVFVFFVFQAVPLQATGAGTAQSVQARR